MLRYEYWKTALLGGEPPEGLWKEERYREYFDSVERERS